MTEHIPEYVDHFKFINIIGSGSFANVFKARDTLKDEIVAIKLFLDRRPNLPRIASEIAFNKLLKHPHIIRIIGYGINKPLSFIAMEYAPKLTFDSYLESYAPLPEYEVQMYTGQICSALLYMHKMKIYHGDVKANNILTFGEEGNLHLKLIDFGLTGVVTEKEQIGSFQSLYLNTAFMMQYDEKCDLFSLGILMYKMFYNGALFAQCLMTSYHCLSDSIPPISFPTIRDVSFDGMDLMKNFLQFEKKNIYSTEEVLEHPYLKKFLKSGTMNKNYFQTVSELVNKALTYIKEKKFDFAMVGFSEALHIMQIKLCEMDPSSMKRFVMMKIEEYLKAIAFLNKIIAGEKGEFPVVEGFGEWENCRQIPSLSETLKEIIDLGFMAEMLIQQKNQEGFSALQNVLRKLNLHLKTFLNEEIFRKREEWIQLLYQYNEN